MPPGRNRGGERLQVLLVFAVRCDERYPRAVALQQTDRGKAQSAGADANAAQLIEKMTPIAHPRDQLAGPAQRRIQFSQSRQPALLCIALAHASVRHADAQNPGHDGADRQSQDQ